MNPRRANRSQLLEMEEGGLRTSAPYASSAEIAEQENERGLGELHDRVNILKRTSTSKACLYYRGPGGGNPAYDRVSSFRPDPSKTPQIRTLDLGLASEDIHEEVDSHNKLLEGMGNAMDASRSLMAGTMDRFTRVFETKSSRNIATIVASCVVIFLLVYYFAR